MDPSFGFNLEVSSKGACPGMERTSQRILVIAANPVEGLTTQVSEQEDAADRTLILLIQQTRRARQPCMVSKYLVRRVSQICITIILCLHRQNATEKY